MTLAELADAPTASLDDALLAFHRDADELDLRKTAEGVHAKYLPLDEAMGQIRPLLTKHGLYVRHYTGKDGDGAWYAGTVVVHAATREHIDSGPFPLVTAKPDAQGWGGALTYARRYTLMEVLGLVADSDDDGAAPARARGTRAAAAGKINAAQRADLNAAVRKSGCGTARAGEIVKRIAAVDSSADIPVTKFAEVKSTILAEPRASA